jgi:pimeloyl-ACP methyl ester carboxylesterase
VNYDNLTVNSHARDLGCILEKEGVREGIFIGFSLGVQVNLEYYSLFPDTVAGLVLMCGGHKNRYRDPFLQLLINRCFPPFLHTSRLFSRALPPMQRCLGKIPVVFHMFRLLGIIGAGCDREKFRDAVRHVANMDLTLYLEMLEALEEHSIEDVLPSIDVPTLIIASEKDFFIPLEVSEFMRDNIPGAHYMLVKGGSHYALIENPGLLVETIADFLGTLDFRTSTMER